MNRLNERIEFVLYGDTLDVSGFVFNEDGWMCSNINTAMRFDTPKEAADFAKKYKLKIIEVVEPDRIDKRNPPVIGKRVVERNHIHAIVRNPKNGKILCLKWKKQNWMTIVMGGVENGENIINAAKREEVPFRL